MLFKLSNLNSNLALMLGYLNPALNKSALGLNFNPGFLICFNCQKQFLGFFSTLFRLSNQSSNFRQKELNWICFWSFHIWIQISHSEPQVILTQLWTTRPWALNSLCISQFYEGFISIVFIMNNFEYLNEIPLSMSYSLIKAKNSKIRGRETSFWHDFRGKGHPYVVHSAYGIKSLNIIP